MLRDAYAAYEHFYVINDEIEDLPPDMSDKTHVIAHAERDILVIRNVFEAIRILRAECPDVILSTGAGPVVPFALVGLVLDIPTLFVESFTRVSRPSLTGRIMYRLAARFYYQWPNLRRFYPNAHFGGRLV